MKPDEGDTDHQRRRRGRRALGVAPGVLPGVGGRWRRTPWSGTPSTCIDRAGDDRAEDEHAEDQRRARRGRAAGGRPWPEPAMPAAKATDAGTGDGEAEHGPLQRSAGVARSPMSRRAAMGLIRLARGPGRPTTSSVTETPTTKAVMTVPRRDHHVAARDVEADGAEERPQAERHAHAGGQADGRGHHADDRPTPAAPTRSTCRRLAPTARSIAISRMRWATMIEKVL